MKKRKYRLTTKGKLMLKLLKTLLIITFLFLILRLMPSAEPERQDTTFARWDESRQCYVEKEWTE